MGGRAVVVVSDDRPVHRPTPELTENDIVEAVCRYLCESGWVIERRADTTVRGVDIVARGPDESLLRVEAKGATSASPKSARYGQPFELRQIKTHVARAFFTAAASPRSRDVSSRGERSAIALPATEHHRVVLDSIKDALDQLGTGVFWVHAPDLVRLDAPWSL